MPDITKSLQDFLSVPPGEMPSSLKFDELIRALQTALEESEDLRRYRETRGRMGAPNRLSLAPPNFPYVVHSS